MFKTMLMGMMILALTSIAAAQSSDYKPLEFFAGYSHHQIDTGIAMMIQPWETSLVTVRAFTD